MATGFGFLILSASAFGAKDNCTNTVEGLGCGRIDGVAWLSVGVLVVGSTASGLQRRANVAVMLCGAMMVALAVQIVGILLVSR